jgi:hypothetical protein
LLRPDWDVWTTLGCCISSLDSADCGSHFSHECPACGTLFIERAWPVAFPEYRPWRIPNLATLETYVASLGEAFEEWVLALFVDAGLNLLSVETISRGSIDSAPINMGRIISRGTSLEAAGFFLVHNHPSGDSTPSSEDIRVTKRIAETADCCDLPLICHVVISSQGMKPVGFW